MAVADRLLERRIASQVRKAISNHDMAKFAGLAGGGPGPVCISPGDNETYDEYARSGLVNIHDGLIYLTSKGVSFAEKWEQLPVVLPA